MVLGTSGMTVMDQATGFSVFANGGFAGLRHGVVQISDPAGKILWDYKRDMPEPKRVLSEKASSEMNSMLVQVPERGTARRASLPMTRVAGKTGTTQNYRDAWFVGYTGNYTAAVWFGNDNYSPMNNLTGGIIPAMTWQMMMLQAHQNIDLKPIPGITNPFPKQAPVADAKLAAQNNSGADGKPQASTPDYPRVLSSETTRFIRGLNETFRKYETPQLIRTTISAL